MLAMKRIGGLSGVPYENLEESVQNRLNEQILVNFREIESEMKRLSESLLSANDITLELFERGLMEFQTDNEITKLAFELNEYLPDIEEPIPVDRLFEIQVWRTNRME
jgi:hypothetical protein